MKDKMNKKEQTIYCVIVVIVLILLAFGDQIFMKFIPQQDNPNDKIFGGSDRLSVEVDNPYFNKIRLEDILIKYENHESFILIILRNNCYMCDVLLKNGEPFFKDASKKIYYIDSDNYSEDNETLIKFKQIDNRIYKYIDLTPLSINFEKGSVVDILVGAEKKERIEEFLTK